MVNADPVVGGLPTYGWTTGLQVGADGRLVGGSGQLATPQGGRQVSVIGADAGAERRRQRGVRPPGRRTAAVPARRAEPWQGGDRSGWPRTPWRGGGRWCRRGMLREYGADRAPRRARRPSRSYPAVNPKSSRRPATPASDPGGAVTELRARRAATQDRRHHVVQRRTAKTLTVRFWGGVCSDYSVSRRGDGSTQVTVEIKTQADDPGQVCIPSPRR